MSHQQSIAPPPCICQHGAEFHSRLMPGHCARCLCHEYRPDKHIYPNGLIPTS